MQDHSEQMHDLMGRCQPGICQSLTTKTKQIPGGAKSPVGTWSSLRAMVIALPTGVHMLVRNAAVATNEYEPQDSGLCLCLCLGQQTFYAPE